MLGLVFKVFGGIECDGYWVEWVLVIYIGDDVCLFKLYIEVSGLDDKYLVKGIVLL